MAQSHSPSPKRSNLDIGSSVEEPPAKRAFTTSNTSTIEVVADDFDDAMHATMDEAVLGLVGRKPYEQLLAVLLSAVVQNSKGRLDAQYGDMGAAKTLLEEHQELKDKMMEAWKNGSFKETRNLGILQPAMHDTDAFMGATVPHTPPNRMRPTMHNQSPRLTHKETKEKLDAAIKAIDNYVKALATGELDFYLDSFRPEGKSNSWRLPHHPVLLIHDLGKHVNQKQMEELFRPDIVHIFSVSGSGKTRLALDGLCMNWGLYISCNATTSGSEDFTEATKMLRTMASWDNGSTSKDLSKSSQAAHRVLAILLCARILVLQQLVKYLPKNVDAVVARRRWVLAQVLPPRIDSNEIFVSVLHRLRNGDTDIMIGITEAMLQNLKKSRPELFPESLPLFVVIDESQVAADYMKEYFRSSTGPDMCTILHEMCSFFLDRKLFSGILLAGTGLSMQMVKEAVGSFSMKGEPVNMNKRPLVFTDTGRFNAHDSAHDSYIRRYLTLSDNVSDRRLMERIKYWFLGRYRSTASVVELLLSENGSPHRTLTKFVDHVTGFKINDAVELEDQEPPLSTAQVLNIQSYGEISQISRVFNAQNMILSQHLANILMRWTLGSQATTIPIEGHMHQIIALGIGFMDSPPSITSFNPKMNYPVYISERLVVLSLRSLFEQQDQKMRQNWMVNSLSTNLNNTTRGFLLEQVTLFVLLDIFGGKFSALADAFKCGGSLGSRRVTLVSLKRMSDGQMQSSPVSWKMGSSDRLGFKAESPSQVLKFLEDPDGKPFLFPDDHMGPDLMCFLQDEETGELILAALQAKITKNISAPIWRKAINSITPQFFYTKVESGGKRSQYASLSYPTLSEDLKTTWEALLGPELSEPILNIYHEKLGSHAEQVAFSATRLTPRFLHVVATPDDKSRAIYDNIAVLRWDAVRDTLGSITDSMKIKENYIIQI